MSSFVFRVSALLWLVGCTTSVTETNNGKPGGSPDPDVATPVPACESATTNDVTGALRANVNGLHALTLRDPEGVAAVAIDRKSAAPAYRFSRFGLDGTRMQDVAIVPRADGDAGFTFANVAESYVFARIALDAVDVHWIDPTAKVSPSLRIAPNPNAGRIDPDQEGITASTISVKHRPQLRSKGDTVSLTWQEMSNEDYGGDASLTGVALLDANGKLFAPVLRQKQLYVTAADITAAADHVFFATRRDIKDTAQIEISRLLRGSSTPLSRIDVQVPWGPRSGLRTGDLTTESVNRNNIVVLGAADGGVDLVSTFCVPERQCGIEVHRFDAQLRGRGKHRFASEPERAVLALHAVAHEGVLYAVWADTDWRSHQFDATDIPPDALHAIALDDAGKERRTDVALGIRGAQIQRETPIGGARVVNGALEVSFTWEKKRMSTDPDYEAHGGMQRFCLGFNTTP